MIDPDLARRFSVHFDIWDDEDRVQMEKEVDSYYAATQTLKDETVTGYEAIGDAFLSFLKVEPEQRDANTMPLDWQVNHAIIGEMHQMPEYEQIRRYTASDPIEAAMAATLMEPVLSKLFDKAKEAQKRAQEAQSLAQQIADLAEQMQNSEDEDEKNSLQEEIDKLQEMLQEAQDAYDQEMAAVKAQAQNEMGTAMNDAADQAQDREDCMNAAGLGGPEVKKMNPKERIELAKKLSTNKFRMLAEYFGHMARIARLAQAQKTNIMPHEIYDVETGDNLSRALPSALVMADDPDLEDDFMVRLFNRQVPQYKLRGTEKKMQGGIVYIYDGSSSMGGSKERWSKALGLVLMKVCVEQKRPFTAIQFGNPGTWRTYEFASERGSYDCHVEQNDGYKADIEGVHSMVEFAEHFFSSGTDFKTPMALGISRLEKEMAEHGSLRGDIIFATDGEATVDQKFMNEFLARVAAIDAKVYGVAIAVNQREPLNTICGGKIIDVVDLAKGTVDMGKLFGQL